MIRIKKHLTWIIFIMLTVLIAVIYLNIVKSEMYSCAGQRTYQINDLELMDFLVKINAYNNKVSMTVNGVLSMTDGTQKKSTDKEHIKSKN